MWKTMILLIALASLPVLQGCGDDSGEKALRSQLEIEQTARADAERDLTRERELRDRERREAQAALRLAERKSLFGTVVAMISGSVTTIVIILAARERRIRSTLTAGLRHLLRRKERHYGP